MKFDYEIAKDACCSIAERKECIEIIDLLCAYLERAKREGLLSLEDELSNINMPFLKKGLALALDGMDPKMLEEILINYIRFGNVRGKELLQQCIVAQGIMSIQSGEDIWLLREKLKSLLGGLSILDEKEQTIQRDLDETFAKEDEKRFCLCLERLKNKKPFSKNTQILESFMPLLNDLQISRLIMEVDVETLAVALSAAGGEVILKILKIYPISWSLHLWDKMESLNYTAEEDKIICQKKMENIYIKLKALEDL